MKMEIAFHNENGFITDFGEELEAKDTITGEVVMKISRYGIWKMSPRNKYEVNYCTNDLTIAKTYLENSDWMEV